MKRLFFSLAVRLIDQIRVLVERIDLVLLKAENHCRYRSRSKAEVVAIARLLRSNSPTALLK